ncbi:ORF-49 [Teiidae poxvirus 1]|nr:ORF-49 [Teiidae poxvirus 1]
MSKRGPKGIQRRNANEESRYTCKQAIEYAKALCTNNTKMVHSVKLIPSQYKSCNTMNLVLEREYKAQSISPFILIEGDTKIYKTKNDNYSREECYFLKIRPTRISPLLYQAMEFIYCELNYLEPDNPIDEKTFRDGFIYINGNKMTSAVIEYTKSNGEVICRKPLSGELETLSRKDPQKATLILLASIFYDNSSMCKISFTLKKIIMEKVQRTTLVDAGGEIITTITSEEEEEETTHYEEEIEQPLFSVH